MREHGKKNKTHTPQAGYILACWGGVLLSAVGDVSLSPNASFGAAAVVEECSHRLATTHTIQGTSTTTAKTMVAGASTLVVTLLFESQIGVVSFAS